MPYPKFLAYNAAGGLVWGTGFVLLGYLAGNSYAAIEQTIGRWAALIVLGVVVVGVVIWRVRHHRADKRRDAEPELHRPAAADNNPTRSEAGGPGRQERPNDGSDPGETQ